MFKENKNKIKTIIKTKPEVNEKHRLNGVQRLKECGLILAVLISTFFAVSLLSFSPADPSWSQTAWGGQLNNAGGYIGAWVADTLFFSFGLLAYPLPLLISLAAWIVLHRRSHDDTESDALDFMLWGTRLLGLVVVLLTSCGLADINFDDLWYFSSGGVVGDVLTNLALPTFNLLGTTLIFLFIWGAGITLLTGISWLTIVEWLGDVSIAIVQRITSKFRQEKEDEYLSPNIDVSQFVDELDATQPDALFAPSVKADDPLQRAAVNPEPHRQPPVVSEAPVEAHEQVANVNPRRFNIHMPNPGAKTSDPSVDRTHQLGATIEELENNAKEFDDFAEQNMAQEASASAEAISPSPRSEWVDDERALPEIEIDDENDDKPSISDFSVADTDEEPPHVVVHQTEAPVDVELQMTSTHSDVVSSEDDDDAEDDEDADSRAFQEMVAQAQQEQMNQQNPFLVKNEVNLPKPKEPLPTLALLYHPEKRDNFIDQSALEEIARMVESKLADYKIKAEVVGIYPGPVITRFELDLAPGVKVSRISGLSMDLARSLSAPAVRVVEVIPGKPYVGLELPNLTRQTVYLSDVISSERFKNSKSPTTVVLGEDIAGETVVADLSKMPHVLVAGTTGSGKSVGVNVMILSMLYKSSPEDVRFIMIDPKMLELSIYEGIPHLLTEVVTDMKDAANALRWCVAEMERRYKLMSVLGVRNIKGFNEKLKMAADAGHPIHDPLWKPGDSMDEQPPMLERLPYIVVIVDEFADLMMVVGKKVEELIARLAQKARAAGIHLILATQRPSVDVITGLIKANIPTRVAFTVSTKTDSRTILDQGGAESLLGMGDMLYLPPGSNHTIRVHGAFASDDDVHAVVNNWKARGKPNYIAEITHGEQGPDGLLPGEKLESEEDMDPLFDQVVEHVVESRRGSVSGVQRRFKIGYNRAARIVEQLEAQGIVSAPGHNGNREVLAPAPPRD